MIVNGRYVGTSSKNQKGQRRENLLIALSLLLLEVVLGRVVTRLAATAAAARAGDGGSVVEEHGTKLAGVRRLALGAENTRTDIRDVDGHLGSHVVGHDAHDDGAGTVSALVLAEVVAAAELLATVGALKGLLTGVERAVVALEVLLTAEATRAESADKGLARVLGEGLLATAAGGRGGRRAGTVVIARGR